MNLNERHTDILHFLCGNCRLEWDESFSMPIIMDVAVTRFKAIACPQCGSKKAYLRTNEPTMALRAEVSK